MVMVSIDLKEQCRLHCLLYLSPDKEKPNALKPPHYAPISQYP